MEEVEIGIFEGRIFEGQEGVKEAMEERKEGDGRNVEEDADDREEEARGRHEGRETGEREVQKSKTRAGE